MNKILKQIAKAVEEENSIVINNKIYLKFTKKYIYVYSFDKNQENGLYEEARLNLDTYCYQNSLYIYTIYNEFI